MKLDRLYKTTKTGAIQICDIFTTGSIVTVVFGQLYGKMQTKDTICKPKNEGKKNATTSEQQAELEALAKHAKKIKEGYTTDPSGEVTVLLPQLVKKYIGNEDKIAFPSYSTPKLNGINGTYWLKDGELTLTSRGGETYPSIPHLEKPILHVMKLLNTTCLNGELYIPGYPLEDIQSAVSATKESSSLLTFNIFELPLYGGTYKDRRQVLLNCLTENGPLFEGILNNISLLVGTEVSSKEDINTHYDLCMANGLEGTVIYNADATYEFNVRSSYVYKYKKTLDAEFEICDCESDKNGHPVFHCLTKEGKLFKVKPKGTNEERLAIINSFESKYLGKYYKVEYEVLSKAGIPLKPVGICLRTCNSNGNPLN